MFERPLRIMQVNTFDIEGGSASIARDLAAAYRARGHQSWLAVGNKLGDDPSVLPIPNEESHRAWARFWRAASAKLKARSPDGSRAPHLARVASILAEPRRSFNLGRGYEEFVYPGTRMLPRLTAQAPEIIHGHNLHGGYFDLRELPALSGQVPFVLTLHDAWLLSGHCAHSFDCDRWKFGCGQCPDLTIYPAIRCDATRHNWRAKREIYLRSRLAIATPSRWLMDKVEQSMLSAALVDARVIPNGVDTSIFRPGDGAKARAELGIHPDTRVLLFVANRARQNRWKDYRTIHQAVAAASKQLDGQDLVLLILGEQAAAERAGRAEVRFLGYQSDTRAVAELYQAADIYLHAAHVDTFPCTVLEALACGKPVVATAVGGIPEQIEDGQTGFLVPAGDVQGFVDRIVRLLTNDDLRNRVGGRAVDSVNKRFEFERQVTSYLQWYRELIELRERDQERAVVRDRDRHALPTAV